MTMPQATREPPCIGLNPDTDPCPYCGAALSDECGSAQAWRVDPDDGTHLEKWDAVAGWVNDCWLASPEAAVKWLADNIKEVRSDAG